MISPGEFIAKIREIWPGGYEPFSGGCWKLHRLLAAIWPGARGWYDGDHIITEIDGRCYDIDGPADLTANFIEADEFGEKYFKGAFRETVNNEERIVNSCKECYRRERRAAGLCVKCDSLVTLNAKGDPAVHCKEHMRQRTRKPKYPGLAEATKVNGRKHVLTPSKYRAVVKLISEQQLSFKRIGTAMRVSERTVRRVAKGEYDSFFMAAN